MTNFTSLKSWLLLAVLFVTGSVAAQTNLLSNAGFEEWNDGKPAHWVTTSTAGNATVSQSTDARTGTYSVQVATNKSNKRLGYEEMVLKAGTYSFEAYVKTVEGTAKPKIGYAVFNEDGSLDGESYFYSENVVEVSNTDWAQLVSEFTLEADTKLCLVVQVPKNSPEVLIDDASLMTTDGGIVEGGEEPEPTPEPDPSGESSKDNPYTVVVAIEKYDAAVVQPETWVKGFIVGYVDGKALNEKSAVFGAEGESVSNTNLLIADAATEKDYTKCLVIQLPSGEVRDVLNLKENPVNLGKSVVLMGSLEKYFGTYGLKSVTEYILDGKEPEPEPTADFVKAKEIVNGKRYAFAVAVDDIYKVAQNVAESYGYGYLYVDDATLSNGVMKLEETNTFTMTAVDGGYTIQDSYGRYLFMDETHNSFNVSAELPAEAYVWTVALAADGKVTITNVARQKWMQYSEQYKSYGAYPDEQGLLPELYIEKGGSSVGGIEVEDNASVEVYTLGGVKVGDSLNGLQKGIYIVKQGKQVKKVVR